MSRAVVADSGERRERRLRAPEVEGSRHRHAASVAPPHDRAMTIPCDDDDRQAAITYAQKPVASTCIAQRNHDFKHGLYVIDVKYFFLMKAA